MKRLLLTALLTTGFAASAMAAPLTLTGDYVRVGISDYGTLGSNGSNSPGILHDSTGTQNFAPSGIPNDYLTPGTPSEGFAISSAQTGLLVNNNSGSSEFGFTSPTLLTGAAALGYDNAASWTGTISSLLSITHNYFFNDGDERILVQTTITALQGLDELVFGRHLDPDPDVNRFGSYNTRNTRGNSLFAPEDLVSAAGLQTGLTIGILDLQDTYRSNTGINSSCCTNDNPYNVLAGYGPVFGSATPYSDGDYGLQMAWYIGSLEAGQSATLRYAYVMGDNQSDVGGDTPLPEPGTLALLGLGLAALGRRRLRQ